MKFTIIYERRRYEVEATNQAHARQAGISHFKVPPNKQHLVIAVPSTSVKFQMPEKAS